ncbi:Microtubule-severing ATPase protein [Dioscorea alata]|uniref:Microtubule-severing ATPase protein n=1 Tax=Dioscorea alata TaxID=55571 RepID=A0ACB7W6X0_DIOAL|nr:Microtubule-severing ATPase protein [Dioscorea alata]
MAAGDGADAGERSWRGDADERLKRLHSLLFGAELALERGDPAMAQILALRLLGFLDSKTLSSIDAAYIAPIRAYASSKLVSASRALASDADRQAFEQARRDSSHVFVKRGDIDMEKIKQSKYFQKFFQKSKGHAVCESARITSLGANLLAQQDSVLRENNKYQADLVESPHHQESLRTTKPMTQTTLTSIYGSKFSKPNNVSYSKLLSSENSRYVECIDVEKEHASCHNLLKANSEPVVLQIDAKDKPHGMAQKTKRRHTEFTSPICESTRSPTNNEESNADTSVNGFVTARTKLEMDAKQRHGLIGSQSPVVSPTNDNPVGNMRSYGMRSGAISRRGLRGNFVPPVRSHGGSTSNMIGSRISGKSDDALEDSTRKCLEMLCGPDGELPEKLRNLEPRLIEHISNEIMDKDPNVRWNDIAGLEHAKKCVVEMVIWPLLRPDIFRGCRSPGRGLLLFGPPGTGKTMIGKAIAGEAKATFFYISASSLTSKWIGEGEKLVRALFGVASCRQPAVIFVDEIDSLLSQRKSEGEHESSRRLKTQFLIEMEGFDSGNEQILLIGATNRPQELDEAARRRLTKRLYIPLPSAARAWIIRNLLEKDGLFKLSEEDTVAICRLTEGYSGSDMKNLVKDASMGPLREALRQGIEITKLRKEDMRPVTLQDFENALQEVRPSVSSNELNTYEDWNRQFGSLAV